MCVVAAIRFRGVSGKELEKTFLDAMFSVTKTSSSAMREVDGRRFTVIGTDAMATYSAGDTFYWLHDTFVGDRFDYSPPPMPPRDELFRDVIRQLPAGP